MNEHIAIIDPDIVLSRSISQRIMHLIPDSKVSFYTPDAIRSDESLCLPEGIIFYDEEGTDPDLLLRHTADASHPHLIPLHSPGTEGRRLLTGTELSRMIREAYSGEQYISKDSGSGYASDSGCGHAIDSGCGHASDSGSGYAIDSGYRSDVQRLREKPEPGLPRLSAARTVQALMEPFKMLLSLTDNQERERFAGREIHALLDAGYRVIRLDLMPGIRMTNPFRPKSSDKGAKNIIPSGISELLLQLDGKHLEPSELLNYLQLGKDGCYHFGLPLRSDDIILCRMEVLVRLICLLRRQVEADTEKTAAIVVVDSLPFQVLKQICPLSRELHVLVPSDGISDDTLCEWELSDLFSSLPPGLKKYVSRSGRTSL